MSDLFIMRRANGDPFVTQVNGEVRIPVWSSKDAVLRSKAHNPELMVFLPAPLRGPMLKKIISGRAADQTPEFFLLADTRDARLDEGRPVKLEELFAEDRAA